MLGMIVITGCYIYTYTHIQSAENKYEIYDDKIDQLEGYINSVSTRLAVVDERYIALTAQISTLNERLSQLINIINNDRRVQRVQLENYGKDPQESQHENNGRIRP